MLLWLPLSSLMELLQALESLRSLLPSPVKDDIICSTRRLVQQEGWVWISPVCHSEKQTNTQTNKWINKLKIFHHQFHLWTVNYWKLLQLCWLVCVFIRRNTNWPIKRRILQTVMKNAYDLSSAHMKIWYASLCTHNMWTYINITKGENAWIPRGEKLLR